MVQIYWLYIYWGQSIDGYNNNNLDQFYDQYRGEIIVDIEGNAIVSNFSQSADFP